jgi:DNA-binding transcriptional LysR family regulator
MQLVALGQVVAVVPESVRRHVRSDVVCVPVLDAPRRSILLAWPDRTRSRAVAAFVRASTVVAHSGRVVETATAP